VLLGNLAPSIREPPQLQRSRRSSRSPRRAIVSGRGGQQRRSYLAGCVIGGGLKARTSRAAAQAICSSTRSLISTHDPRAADQSDGRRDLVVALASYRSFASGLRNVLLPVVPSRRHRHLHQCEGRMPSFSGAVKPLGEARPAWKVLRVPRPMMSLPGFVTSHRGIREETAGPKL